METKLNIYRINYFINNIVGVILGTFIPLILVEARGFSITELSLIFLAQFPAFFKPLIGLKITEKLKFNLMMGSTIFLVSLLIITLGIYTYPFGLLFTLFVILNLGQAIMDTATDALVLEEDKSDNITATLNFRIFGTLGYFIVSFMYIYIVPEDNSSGWEYIFLFVLLSPILMLIVSRNLTLEKREDKGKEKDLSEFNAIFKKAGILIMLYMILSNSQYLLDSTNELFLVGKFGKSGFNSFLFISQIFGVVGLLFLIILYKKKEWVKMNRPYLIIICGITAIVLYVILNIGSLNTILVMTAIWSIMATILQFCFISILIESTPLKNRAMWYQLYALVYLLAKVFYQVIGGLIYYAVGFGYLCLVAIILFLCLIPVLLKMNMKDLEKVNK